MWFLTPHTLAKIWLEILFMFLEFYEIPLSFSIFIFVSNFTTTSLNVSLTWKFHLLTDKCNLSPLYLLFALRKANILLFFFFSYHISLLKDIFDIVLNFFSILGWYCHTKMEVTLLRWWFINVKNWRLGIGEERPINSLI